ncbi:MAG: LysM peptidoglycan-binding domain-containing protein [Anaerolineaceae bacterium]|nr:LysM peptidoglycan-binding domain-containing protein [Anaerolineaceae bacterium]MCB9101427.1 LysM peptidoglycan-binding domain-containing protein [Anaerolineales bacterium]
MNFRKLIKDLNFRKLREDLDFREIVDNLPRRAWASLILIVILTGVVFYIQAKIQSVAQTTTQVEYVRGLRDAPAPPTPDSFIRAWLSRKFSFGRNRTPTATVTVEPQITATPFFVFHTVGVSETLISIAAQYNVTTEELLATNQIRDPNSLEEGQQLLIPPDDSVYQGELIPYTIKEGDSLIGIASKYGSSVKALQVANPILKNDELTPDEHIVVPVLFSSAHPINTFAGGADPVMYTVEWGDTPLAIALKYNVPLEILLTVNDIQDPTSLQIGQELLIPVNDELDYSFPVILYELQENDTLVGIASRFGSSVKDILAVNPDLDPGSLEAGQLVAIPVIFAPVKPTPVPIPNRPTGPPPTPLPPPPMLVDLQQQMINAINVQRANFGLSPYQIDKGLTDVALAHAQDMVVRDFLAHTNPDGQSPRDRLINYGFTDMYKVGENIQRNTRPRDSTVDEAVNWFMNSPVHRAGLLNTEYNRIGVGAVEGPPGWFTFVIVFIEQ